MSVCVRVRVCVLNPSSTVQLQREGKGTTVYWAMERPAIARGVVFFVNGGV